MASVGRSSIHEPVPEEAAGLTFLDRVNAFGERHARAIIIVSTALIIVTVLIFAQVLWNRTLFDRVERELVTSTSTESLEALRKRYAGSAAEPRILATLGHRYATDAKLAEAKAVYTEFLSKYAGHVLASGVNRSLAQVEENLKFLETRKAAAANEPQLNSHPIRAAGMADHPLKTGPVKEPHPQAVLKFKGKPDEVRIELFEDEAPNAVAAFVTLAEQKYFAGLTFARVGTDERVRVNAKKENPSPAEVAFEKTNRPAEFGSLALVRRGPNNAAAEFEFVLKPGGVPSDSTIFGKAFTEGAAGALLAKLEDKDEIESVTIEKKRKHDYKAQYLKQ
ncbi:MAG TPA: peptidylprolyl isomerase [Planctomycetota bacterium]|nr:peptidylprolyl isomerase [Planctomycetota bacterium]